MFRAAVASTLLAVTGTAAGAPTTVRVVFVEALAPRDTTSSERFQKDFDHAISLGKHSLEKRLRACGYTLETEKSFYDASDPLQAKERGADLERKGTWLIVGPRRSNHYILLSQGASSTPTVSLMASAPEIAALGPKHVSLNPLNSELAIAAAAETHARLRRAKNRTYVSFVSKDCGTCVDFAEVFAKEATKLGLKEVARFEAAGDAPDTSALVAKVKETQPTFVLLPNYSKVASLVMASLGPVNAKLFYVGSDGWGDANFGFVHKSGGTTAANGFAIRGLPPIEKGLGQFKLGRELARRKEALPKGGPALGILKALDGLTEILCQNRAGSRETFMKAFERSSKQVFQSPWGTSLFALKDGEVSYSRTLKRSVGSAR